MPALAKSWNQPPIHFVEKRATRTRQLITCSAAFIVAALCSIWLAHYCDRFLQASGISLARPWHSLSGIVGYVGAAIFGVLALHNLLPPPQQDASWVKSLNDGQKKLLGFAPGFSGKTVVAAQPKAGAASPLTPLGPPLRGSRAATITGTPASDGGNASSIQRAVASVSRSDGRISPFSARRLSTPVQLQQLMDEFQLETQATEGTPASPLEGVPYTGPAYMPGPFGSPATSSPGDGRRLGAGRGQHLGPAPTYRPSAVPKGAAALPHRPDGPVQASSQESFETVLHQLGTSEKQMEEYRERLREWLAFEMLQPLVRAVDGAHQDVVNTAAQLGWQGLQLAPLHLVITGSLPNAEGALTLGDSSSKGRALAQADDELLVKQMHDSLLTRVSALPPSHQPPQEVVSCIHALVRYQKLAALLRGEYPAGLLPLSPPGYLAWRVRDLADGSCLKGFTWNKGGTYNGKPWSVESPTDSAVVFYLFAAFLASAHWEFSKDDAIDRGPMGPLYLGKLPSKVAEQYFAVLSHRPQSKQNQKGSGIVGLLLGSQQPHFALLLQGETFVTLTEQNALMDAIIFFIIHCKRHTGGYLGPQTLQYLNLQHVICTPTFRLAGRVFGLW